MSEPPPYYPPPPPPPPVVAKRPWWKALWFVGLVALVVGGIIGAAGGSSGKSKPKAAPTVTQTATATSTLTEESTVTEKPTVVKTIATRTRTHTVTYTPPVKIAFSDGTFRVGSEIKPGTYHTDPPADGCYYEEDSSTTPGDIDSIITNDNITGPTTIDIGSDVKVFTSQGGCDWVRR